MGSTLSDMISIELIGGPSDGDVWAHPGPDAPRVIRVALPLPLSLIEPTETCPLEPLRYGEYGLRYDPWLHRPSRTDSGGYRYDWRGTQ